MIRSVGGGPLSFFRLNGHVQMRAAKVERFDAGIKPYAAVGIHGPKLAQFRQEPMMGKRGVNPEIDGPFAFPRQDALGCVLKFIEESGDLLSKCATRFRQLDRARPSPSNSFMDYSTGNQLGETWFRIPDVSARAIIAGYHDVDGETLGALNRKTGNTVRDTGNSHAQP